MPKILLHFYLKLLSTHENKTKTFISLRKNYFALYNILYLYLILRQIYVIGT